MIFDKIFIVLSYVYLGSLVFISLKAAILKNSLIGFVVAGAITVVTAWLVIETK